MFTFRFHFFFFEVVVVVDLWIFLQLFVFYFVTHIVGSGSHPKEEERVTFVCGIDRHGCTFA